MTRHEPAPAPGRTAFPSDLDGPLVGSVYQHVLVWHEAPAAVGLGWPSGPSTAGSG